jgi:hypothetical protein
LAVGFRTVSTFFLIVVVEPIEIVGLVISTGACRFTLHSPRSSG